MWAVVSIGVFMASLDLFIVNIAFPDIARGLRRRALAGLSWVLNAYAIVFAALLVPAGRWSDRARPQARLPRRARGLRRRLARCARLAPSVEVLVAARVLQAAGAALLVPDLARPAAAGVPAGAARRSRSALWAAVGGVAAAAGPPVGGLLVEVDWRWVFLVNVPIGLVALVAARTLLREITRADRRGRARHARRRLLIGRGRRADRSGS